MDLYKTRSATPLSVDVKSRAQQPFGPLIIATFLVLAVLVGMLSIVVPSIRTATMPRFGWVGLIICLNPLIFLLPWFWKPTKLALVSSAFMTCVIGAINAVQLYSKGTVSIVVNAFHDRLHSSWLWSVLPFFVASVYLCWITIRMKQIPKSSRSRVRSQPMQIE